MHSTTPWDAAENALADLGELAGPLTHEVNNLLNNLTLHLALQKDAAPDELGADLQTIRKQITDVAGVVMRFQRRRNRDRAEPTLVDVNLALREAADDLQAWSSGGHTALRIHVLLKGEPAKLPDDVVGVALEPQDDLPAVLGYPGDVRRLCRFLLANAVRAMSPGGPPARARTAREGNAIRLEVEDEGPEVALVDLAGIFNPGHERREGMCCLELAACRSIVRRLRGNLQAQPRPGGGLMMIAVLPAAVV
jgi:signal transduction histidine kinase